MWVDPLDNRKNWSYHWLLSVVDDFVKYQKQNPIVEPSTNEQKLIESRKQLVEYCKSKLQYPSFMDDHGNVLVHLPEEVVVYYKLKYE